MTATRSVTWCANPSGQRYCRFSWPRTLPASAKQLRREVVNLLSEAREEPNLGGGSGLSWGLVGANQVVEDLGCGNCGFNATA